ncbi:MAG: helix-hairpin-helix domain-containing protein [Flavobacteriaceae bacterium]
MSRLTQFFTFNRKQRKGIFAFFGLMLLLQGIYFWVSSRENPAENPTQTAWLHHQKVVDSLKGVSEPKYTLYPFNPNFISDFKGYQLGMSVEEIDRLLAFRKTEKFVNSAKEFQQVTGVSDSLLNVISPYFKFPEWVTAPKKASHQSFKTFDTKKEAIIPKDLNLATQDDLIKVWGIGEKLSERILKHKATLGCFVAMQQLEEVYGLSPEVIAELHKHFFVSEISGIKKIKINELSIKELGVFPYFKYPISKNIVVYRSNNGEIRNSDDLAKIPDFPVEKIEIIALYLEF